MEAARAEGERGLGHTAPNPPVGCVLVRGGRVVARGHHRRAGQRHAEIEALHAAGGRARGATAYVTLEPCSHYGRTPPCAEAVAAAGVARVVSALEDPDPRVHGGGHRTLRAEGIGVQVHYLPVHLHPFYGGRRGQCPRAEAAYDRMLSLPLFPAMTDADADHVIEAVGKGLGFYSR